MDEPLLQFIRDHLAEVGRGSEAQNKAATDIQRLARGHLSRQNTRGLATAQKNAATTIQKVVRGNQSRKNTRAMTASRIVFY